MLLNGLPELVVVPESAHEALPQPAHELARLQVEGVEELEDAEHQRLVTAVVELFEDVEATLHLSLAQLRIDSLLFWVESIAIASS